LFGRQLISVKAGSLADELKIQADLIHRFYSLGKIRRVVVVDFGFFAREGVELLRGFRRRVMRVPIDPG
jgi:hypothetical protein